MKLISILYFPYSLILFFMFYSIESSQATRYDGIFTRDIYNLQAEVDAILPELIARGLTEDELNISLVQLLFQKKREMIYRKEILDIQAKVETLVRAKRMELRKQARDGAIDIAAGILNIAGSLLSFRFGDAFKTGVKMLSGPEVPGSDERSDGAASAGQDPVESMGHAVGTLLSSGSQGAKMLASGIFNLIEGIDGFQRGTDDIFVQAERLGIFSLTVTEMRLRRDRLLTEFAEELWHEYEEKYIQKKRFLSLELQKSFENKFISARAVGGLGTEQYLGYFNTSLEVATHKKRIGEQEDSDQAARVLLRQFDEHPLLRGYSPEVRHEMKKMIITVLYFSRFNEQPAGDVRRPYFRRAFYLYGGPGVGKSSAARTLAEFLGLPYCEKTVFNVADISEKNLLGTPLWGKQNAGWIGEALTVKNSPEHKSYKNAFLILNDFDRVLVGKDKSANALLLYLLDPDTRNAKSDFFEGMIDVGSLFIILTGNQRLTNPIGQALEQQGVQPVIPPAPVVPVDPQPVAPVPQVAVQAAVAPQSFDDFGALERRLKTIEFGAFEHVRRQAAYRNQVIKLMTMFMLNNIHQVVQEETVTHAMRQPGLSEGLIELSERYTEYKLRRLEGGFQ